MTETKYREFADIICGLGFVSNPRIEAHFICRMLGVSRAEIDERLKNELGVSLRELLARLPKHS